VNKATIAWSIAIVAVGAGFFIFGLSFSGDVSSSLTSVSETGGTEFGFGGTLLIGTKDIADKAITRQKIAPGAVISGKIAPGAVTSGKIADDAITLEKLAEGAKITFYRVEDRVGFASCDAGDTVVGGGGRIVGPGFSITRSEPDGNGWIVENVRINVIHPVVPPGVAPAPSIVETISSGFATVICADTALPLHLS